MLHEPVLLNLDTNGGLIYPVGLGKPLGEVLRFILYMY